LSIYENVVVDEKQSFLVEILKTRYVSQSKKQEEHVPMLVIRVFSCFGSQKTSFSGIKKHIKLGVFK